MARKPIPGSDQGDWGRILNEFLDVSLNADGSIKGSSVSGGTIQDGSITPSKLSANAPASGNVLSYNGSNFSWVAPATGSTVSDATTSAKGVVQLAGDLSGTAAAPTVPGLANKANITHTHTIANVTNLQTTLDAKYTKPGTGIPATDLTTTVQSSLAAADARDAAKLQGTNVDGAVPADGQHLMYSATAGAWVAGTTTSTTVTDATTTSKGILQLGGDLGGTASAPTVPGLANKANATDVYTKTEVDTAVGARIAATEKGAASGVATLGTDGKVPAAQLPASTTVSDATTTAKGIVQLAGDLGGTADAPTVPGLAKKVDATEKGAINGVATLGADGKVPSAQLPASSGGGTFTASVKNAAYTCVNYDFLLCDGSASGFTITLPPVGNGVWVRIKKTDSTTNGIIVVGQNSSTINGSASYVLNIQNASQDIMSDGTSWHLI